MFYPSKLAFCNFIQLEKWSVECDASFLFLFKKRPLVYFYVLQFKLGICNFIQLEKWSVECGASFLNLYPKTLSCISMFYLSKLAFCNFIQLEKWSVEFYIQKSNIQHSHPNSLFTFDELLLDAESVLEYVLDTNPTSFLRRFWIRYQNGTTSNKKKVTCLVLQVVFFSKIPPRRAD